MSRAISRLARRPFPRIHHRNPSGIIDSVTSAGIENLARAAYEAHRGVQPGSLPPWEDASDKDKEAWKAAVSAVAGQTGVTLHDVEAVPTQSIHVQIADQRSSFHTDFIAGRQGALVINDEYCSNHHARFQLAHGFWFVRDLGSTNGTWLNGRRIHAPQRLKKGDKIRIGHTVVVVTGT
jgi:pSer/pThr/pTyr-binding forkhead associated (FHA) protein